MILLMNLNVLMIVCAFLAEPLWLRILFVLLQGIIMWFMLSIWEDLNERVDNLELTVGLLIRKEVGYDGD